ncbi:MAG TPA: hypothetical protein VFN96_07730 [Gemmatimonadales bacterium]|nr:hypothetical protein [Gemmatimonadales bacterium]
MRGTALLTAALALAGCRSNAASAEAALEPGRVRIEWSGSTSGRFAAPAVARWCATDTLVEILAMRADTGVGLILLVRDSVEAGDYPVAAARSFSSRRPGASVAVRWLDTSSVRGYEGVRGRVALTAGGALAGTFEALLRANAGLAGDTLAVRGELSGITLSTADSLCGRWNRPGG